MRKFSNVLTEETNELRAPLHGGPSRKPVSERDRIIDKDRVDKERLEEAYRVVPIIFGAVNRWTQAIVSRDWSVEGPHSDEALEFLEKEVGHKGGELHWDDIRESIYKYLAIYGEAFVEILPNQSEDDIIDLVLIDPKTIDYARSDKGHVAFDEYDNPYGYVQGVNQLRYMQGSVDQVYDIPQEVFLRRGEVYIPRQYIAHFKMHTYGEGLFPTGLVEPAFGSAERSIQLRRDYGDRAHASLFPTRVAYVGDEMHQPTTEQVDAYGDLLASAEADTEISVPYTVDIEMLEAENPTGMIDVLKHYNNDIMNAFPIPKAHATGRGSNVNRATLAVQDRMMQISMRDIIDRTEKTVEREIFGELARMRGWDDLPNINVDKSVKTQEELSDVGFDMDEAVENINPQQFEEAILNE